MQNAAACFLALLALLLAACERGAPPWLSPVMLWVEGAPATQALPPEGGRDPGAQDLAASLAWQTLPPSVQAIVEERLTALAEQIELQMNPLWVELAPTEDQFLRPAVERLLPIFSTASSLAAGRWRSVDGAIRVHAARCSPPGDSSLSEATIRRARFIAWPLARAVLLRVGSPERAQRLGAGLRASAIARDSLIGVVMVGAERAAGDPVANTRLRRAAARLERVAPEDLIIPHPVLTSLAGIADKVAVPPWLQLAASEVLVAPRLSASDESTFATYVLEQVDALGVQVQRAAPLRLVALSSAEHACQR